MNAQDFMNKKARMLKELYTWVKLNGLKMSKSKFRESVKNILFDQEYDEFLTYDEFTFLRCDWEDIYDLEGELCFNTDQDIEGFCKKIAEILYWIDYTVVDMPTAKIVNERLGKVENFRFIRNPASKTISKNPYTISDTLVDLSTISDDRLGRERDFAFLGNPPDSYEF